MKAIFTLAGWLLLQSLSAQQSVDVSSNDRRVGNNSFFSVGGTPFVNYKYVSLVEGSPYFKDQWLKAYTIDKDGNQYRSDNVRLDLMDHSIHYLDAKGSDFILNGNMKEIVMDSGTYRFINSAFLPQGAPTMKQGWYEVLDTGKASLYRFFDKVIFEQRPYNSATTEQHITTKEKYFIYSNGSFTEVKKPKDVPAVLSARKSELETFLQKNDNKDASTDARLKAVVAYYNQLSR